MICAAFDTETTGLALHPDTKINLQPYATDIAVVLLDQDGTILETFETLVNPGIPLTAEITKITGLTDADLAGQPRFYEIVDQFQAIMRKADIVCAHNLPFDEAIIGFQLERCGKKDFVWPRHRLCTAQLYAEIWGRRPRLINLYEKVFGVPLDQKHRAMSDTQALASIVAHEHLIDLFEGIKS